MRSRRYRPSLRGAARVALLAGLSAVLCGPPGPAEAASPRDRAYLVCANGYEGDPGECPRLCRLYLKQKGDPLGDMRSTCVSRLTKPKAQRIGDPD